MPQQQPAALVGQFAATRCPGRRKPRCAVWLLALLPALASWPHAATAQNANSLPGLTLGGPHTLHRPRARLSTDLRRRALARAHQHGVHSVAQPLALALQLTSESLHFGLGHRTRLRFHTTERSGNCVEYAHLFAGLFNLVARRQRVPARAVVVRSHGPRLLGFRVPLRSFRDHDWVLVQPRGPGKPLYVDPSFFDAGLGWDVSQRVRGTLPRWRPPRHGRR